MTIGQLVALPILTIAEAQQATTSPYTPSSAPVKEPLLASSLNA